MSGARSSPPDADELEVSVFGPSKGECIIVHVPNGPWFVVDSFRVQGEAGPVPVAVAYLRDMLKVADVYGVMITHWHDDHSAGAADVLRAFAPSLRVVGLPSAYGRRELASFAADLLPDPLGSRIIKDIVAVITELSEPATQHVRRIPLNDGAQLEPPGNVVWKLSCLSPSMEDERHHFSTLLKFLPGYVGPAPHAYDVNSGCAVLRFEVGETVVMLCSDLDVGDGPQRGWRCIVQNHGARLRSDVVKVGHHGSSTAFHEAAWAAFGALGKPRGVITPFPANGGQLPRPEMVGRLVRVAEPLHLTAIGKKHAKRAGKLLASDSPFQAYTPTSPRTFEAIGQVRYRQSWGQREIRVEVFPPARALP
jgi:hypothetical protein